MELKEKVTDGNKTSNFHMIENYTINFLNKKVHLVQKNISGITHYKTQQQHKILYFPCRTHNKKSKVLFWPCSKHWNEDLTMTWTYLCGNLTIHYVSKFTMSKYTVTKVLVSLEEINTIFRSFKVKGCK